MDKGEIKGIGDGLKDLVRERKGLWEKTKMECGRICPIGEIDITTSFSKRWSKLL